MGVDPHCSRDVEALLHEGRRLRAVVGRTNLYVGVPSTVEGMSAIQELLCEGISVDARAVYGPEQLRQVVAAVLAGFEQAASRGRDLSQLSAVVTFRVAELDAEHTRGDAAVAAAATARGVMEQAFTGDFWRRLGARGARPPRLALATASADGPAGADTMYAERLVGQGTINAVSLPTLRGLVDHGKPVGRCPKDPPNAPREAVRRAVGRAGVHLEAVANTLQDKRIRRLMQARDAAVASLRARRV